MTGMTKDVRVAADQLRADRRPFVTATVVRAERPTSAKAGDTALVLDDGTVMGFVGGECAQASVQAQALAALETGAAVLLRITPDAPDTGVASAPSESGTITVHNPCLSGGTLEIFLEPEVPPLFVLVHGDAPIARALRELAEWLGYDGRAADGALTAPLPDDVDALVVASHGGDEDPLLRSALETGVPYIGLVASPKRGAAVLDALGLSADQRQRIHTPAGFDIGSRTPQETALSILAEIVAQLPREPRLRHEAHEQHQQQHEQHEQHGSHEHAMGSEATTALDPVCGMSVAMVASSRHADHQGVRYWFCGSGCEQAFRADPASFVGS